MKIDDVSTADMTKDSFYKRKISIIGYEATQKSGWGIARYTFQLLKNFKLMQELNNFKIDFIAHGTPPSNIIARNLKKVLFFSIETLEGVPVA